MDDFLHLSISDDGNGFDMKATSDRHGLGVWGMRERVRMVAGQFEIDSEKQKGTRIEVWTPIKLNSDAIRSNPDSEPAPAAVAATTPGTG